ncbi:NAD(P)/FAD-dependent oxidoreductase [Streptomyces hoynatensis]|uniref:NAD(P)/FAD-dependent oxidoreductase n=1 Tax=Streptomyces hoynatensis TaxID=1141874 RepID=A0A3A9YVP1_9ACTN|nr:FAD-dependent oxidoreductase [Streptomyces hoynatensis]RKN40122.1 NAD(P)/FAD-dependent oxidoreductase [Streptomyces hoynatensis]
MPAPAAHVIVGAGLAGAVAARTLREEGYEGPLVLIGEEREPPYERPALSKGYLSGAEPRESLLVHPPEWYAEHEVDLRLGLPATALDPGRHEVVLRDGTRIGYAALLLATGSTPCPLDIPGAELEGVRRLRRIEDSDRLRAAFRTASRLVVLGGGWLGLETAAVARQAGLDVTVLEMTELPLLGLLGREVSAVFADLHRGHGVDLRFGVQAAEITGRGGAAEGVQLSDGTHIEADVIVVAIGDVPNTGLAHAAGLRVRDGVETDERLRTSAPGVFAAGDVACAFHPVLGRHLRVDHWANAVHQPRTAARAMLGREAAYDRLPYVFTDQYGLGMEYVGHVAPGECDRVVLRGDPGEGEFLAFWLGEGRPLAAMSVNMPGAMVPLAALVRAGRPVDPARLADAAVPPTALLDRAGPRG